MTERRGTEEKLLRCALKIIVIRFVRRAGRLLELVSKFKETPIADVEDEIGNVIAEAIGRPWATQMTPRQRELWDAAQGLCPDRRKLAEAIRRDGAVRGLRPGVAPEQALCQILLAHLTARLWEILGRTEHEARVWAKLCQISEELMREHKHPPPPGYRCSRKYFKEIRLRIRRDMPDDQRIGKIKTETIEAYFYRFCDECRELAAREYEISRREPEGGGANGLPPRLKEKILRRLEECIDRLDEPLRDVVHAWLQPDKGAKYRCQEEMEKGEFDRRLKLALRKLCMCLDSWKPEDRDGD